MVLKNNKTFRQVQQLLHPSPVVLCSFLGMLHPNCHKEKLIIKVIFTYFKIMQTMKFLVV